MIRLSYALVSIQIIHGLEPEYLHNKISINTENADYPHKMMKIMFLCHIITCIREIAMWSMSHHAETSNVE